MAAPPHMLSPSTGRSSSSPPPPPPQQQPQLYPHACSTCVQRKVKCDKRHPCLACTKSYLQCHYRSTPPPQRRKRKIVELTRAAGSQALVEKLRAHEALLRGAGLDFDAFDEDSLIAANEGNNDGDGGGDGDRDGVEDGDRDGNGAGGNNGQSQRRPRPLAAAAESLMIRPGAAAAGGTIAAGAAEASQATLFPRQRGILIPEYGGRRYYEHALIGLLGQKYKQGPPVGWQQQPTQHDALLPSLITGVTGVTGLATTTAPQDVPTYPQHPPAATALQYWAIFKENVHPLTMILHAPTVQQIMTDRGGTALSPSAAPADVPPPPRSRDALQFSIYACAVASLRDEDCQRVFGESQASLLRAMQSATRWALTEASFLRLPDLDLLRAFVLLLTSMLHTVDSPSLWVMLGTAMRLAQAQGLHRDGAALGLSPFDTEMRRRLWWYIVSLDARVTEIMGAESCLPRSADTRLPANADDSHLDPNMAALPADRPGPSDMMFCLAEYETVRFLQRRDPRVDDHDHDRADSQTTTASTTNNGAAAAAPSNKLATVPDLERYLEDKFLRFCDPVMPLHLLTTAIARSRICKLRQMGHRGRSQSPPPQQSQLSQPPPASQNRGGVGHHRRSSGGGFDARAEQANNMRILATAARTISYDNLIHGSPSLAGFLWHVRYWFPWGSPIFILKIMASLRSAAEWDRDDVQAAWQQIEALHAHHPEFAAFDAEKPEHLVVGELTLKAWNAREAVFRAEREAGTAAGGRRGQQQQPQQIPQLIADLQARHRTGGALYQWHHMDQQQQHQQQQHYQVAANQAAHGRMGTIVDAAAAAAAAAGGNLGDMVASFNNAASFAAAAAAAAAAGGTGAGGGGDGRPGLVDSPFMGVDWSDWDATRMY